MLPLLRLLTVGTALIGLAACTTKPMQKLPDSKANASKMAIDAPASDIVDTAISAGGFNTLVAAVAAADLVDTLKSNGPFTVFAPTDEAFATLPEGTLESLLKPENKEKLQAILTYHVLPGKVLAADISGKRLDATTVNGQTVSVDGNNGVRINNATVISADIKTSNGVIHVIDSVLLP